MAAKKSGLGRGLDALFPEKPKVSQNQSKSGTVNQESKKEKENEKKGKETDQKAEDSELKLPGELMVKTSLVSPNKTQPRKQFDEDALLELSESLKQYGVLQPILVSEKKDSNNNIFYEIIAGERRWRAARMAGLKEIPVLIKEFNEQEIVEISLIENIQREDLNPIEEAMAYKRLIEEFRLKQDEVADKVSKSRTAVTNSMRLLKLDERVQQMLIDDMLSSGHARALLSVMEGELQYSLAMKIFDEKLSVRETERMVKLATEPPKEKPVLVPNLSEEAIYESLEEKMKRIMGTRVFIKRKKNNKGRIEIEYYSKDELERLIDLFDSIQ